jgi:hypothetical protein
MKSFLALYQFNKPFYMRNQTFSTLIFTTFLLFGVEVLFAQPKLEFSHEHGFYKSSFQLFIKSSDQGGKIKYTLDGSDPKNSPIAQISGSPAELFVNPYINTGRAATAGVIVRACAISGTDTSRTYTQSYIFLSEVKYQDDVSTELLPYWPDKFQIPSHYSPNLIDWMRTDQQYINLAVAPKVVYRDEYYDSFENDLLSIPTVSLVTDPACLFNDSTGIYNNGTWPGIEWERPASLELLDPSNEGFQVNTGIRIRGGVSSKGDFAKHAFRLFFREKYGDAKLKYPLFGTDGTDEFDKIDLRCEVNNSWSYGNQQADYIHEAFSREIQRDMSQPYTRSRYYHLFLNGMYWGLYETQERAEARFAESYMGGVKENYDVVKSSAASIDYPPYTLEATDGNLNSSKALWDIAIDSFTHENYFKAMGLNPDGSANPAYPKYLDPDNLISYVMIIYFSANHDGPGLLGTDNKGNPEMRINNFFGIFNRENPDGFKYCIHDNESAYYFPNDDITNIPTYAGWTFESFNPMWLHQRLMDNPDYKQKFADLACKYLFDNGALTSQRNISRFQNRVNLIDNAIVGETARWANMRGSFLLTRDNTWIPAINNMLRTYFPQRTQIVIDQFKNMGWLNQLTPPAFDENQFESNEKGTLIKGGSFKLINKNPSGKIFYTINNTDPRAPGGTVADSAILYSSEISVPKTIFMKARIKDGDQWSPLTERVIINNDGSNLRISEISYNPLTQLIGNDTLKSKELEFVEIKNLSNSDIDLSGYQISGGIKFNFPASSALKAGGLVVVASDSASFRKLYGFSPHGQYSGNLKSEGETFNFINPCGSILFNVSYNSNDIWFSSTDGSGYTLVTSSYSIEKPNNGKSDWRISTNCLGSPGADDPLATDTLIVFSEVLANSEKPFIDFFELYNPNNYSVNIGHWFVSNEKIKPQMWKIPDGTIIQPKSYLAFNEGHFVSDSLQFSPNEFGTAFSLSKGGEKIYLFSGNGEGKLISSIAEYNFGATDVNTSFGEFISQSGKAHNIELEYQSVGAKNSSSKKSPIIFRTIMYHPIEGNYEFIVLKNRTDSTVNLFCDDYPEITWKVKGIDFDFPQGVTLSAGDSLFLVEKMLPSEVFKSTMNLTGEVKVFNYMGKLSNGGEPVTIQKPLPVETDTATVFKYIDLEEIEFDDQSPWPKDADGNGFALIRKDNNAFGNDPSNWTEVFKTIPVAIAGNNTRVRVNTKLILNGSGSNDQRNLPLTYNWNLVSKPAGSNVTLTNKTIFNPQFTPDKAGNYLFSLQVSNGTNKSIPAFVSTFAYNNAEPVTQNNVRTYYINLHQSLLLQDIDCYDPDYEEVNCLWGVVEKPVGSSISLENFNSKSYNFTPDVVGSYRFSMIVSDNQLSGKSITIKVIVSPVTGINTIASNNYSVYPNPVNDEAYIEFNLEKSSDVNITITDVSGRKIITREYGSFESGNQIITMNFLELSVAEGIYFINLRTGEYSINKKVYYLPEN